MTTLRVSGDLSISSMTGRVPPLRCMPILCAFARQYSMKILVVHKRVLLSAGHAQSRDVTVRT